METKAFDYIMHYEPTRKGLQWQVFSEPLVRCKDCKYLFSDSGCPLRTWRTHVETDYCSYGERKEDNDGDVY